MRAFGPHAAEAPVITGAALEHAAGALILVHGRGGSAEAIMSLAESVSRPDLAVVAPRAAGNSWYPQSFLAPVAANEPGRSSGLAVLDSLVHDLGESEIPPERLLLAGFSQGACLTLEFVARSPRRYGAVAGLTGGLIGPPGSLDGFSGSLGGTPVFLASGDPDPHVPWTRVEETAAILESLGAHVRLRRYPGRAHTVSRDELGHLGALVEEVFGDPRSERRRAGVEHQGFGDPGGV